MTLRKRVLELALGKVPNAKKRSWRCFPIESKHIGKPILDPKTFHRTLCQQVVNARNRVHIASLYVGPGAHIKKYGREVEFLRALSQIDPSVDVKVLLDQNRALRPVKLPDSDQTITSAQACKESLKPDAKICLISILSRSLYRFLPNPLNEVAGVFHVKLYVIDDDVIISGANLSQEYFADRHDRYLWLRKGANGLVDTYSELISTLCDLGAHQYVSPLDPASYDPIPISKKEQLLHSLIDILTDDATNPTANTIQSSSEVVAHAVPTLQVPTDYFEHVQSRRNRELPSDCETIHQLLEHVGTFSSGTFHLRLASAYLNPTPLLLSATQNINLHCLTAGNLSHGFRPKNVAGNQSATAWIPKVFDHIASLLPDKVSVWYYQREDWTFHSKGLWLFNRREKSAEFEDGAKIMPHDDILAGTFGSGNYGWRSEARDMESNLIVVFPTDNELSRNVALEWNQMMNFAERRMGPTNAPWYIHWALRIIRSCF